MKNEKILGYFLLIIGLILVAAAMRGAYTVFTGIAKPAQMFKISSVVFSVPGQAGNPATSVELLSGEVASKFADMGIWYILMLFVVSGGAKIASLGIQLIKEIKVVVKGS
jgi:hypothetical protein